MIVYLLLYLIAGLITSLIIFHGSVKLRKINPKYTILTDEQIKSNVVICGIVWPITWVFMTFGFCWGLYITMTKRV